MRISNHSLSFSSYQVLGLLSGYHKEEILSNLTLPTPPSNQELAERLRNAGVPTSRNKHWLKRYFSPWVDVESFIEPGWNIEIIKVDEGLAEINIRLSFTVEKHGKFSQEQNGIMRQIFKSYQQTLTVPFEFEPRKVEPYSFCDGLTCDCCH